MGLVVDTLAYLTLFLDIGLIGALFYFVAKKAGYDLRDYDYLRKVKQLIADYNRRIALIIALTATAGSLYLSNSPFWIELGQGGFELVKRSNLWDPCRLCWFQRILMYPLVLILGTGIFTMDKDLKDYVLPLAIVGTPIALIHSLVQRYEQFQAAGCSVTSISCATEYTFHFGYVTIPVMALTAFLAIAVLIWRFD